MLDTCVSRENVGLSRNVLIYELMHYENIYTPSWIGLLDFPVPSIKYRLSNQKNTQIEYQKI